MRTISKILLATDFSECSEHAQAYAFALAKRFKAPVHVAHVVDTAYPSHAGVYGLGAEVDLHIDEVKKHAQAQLMNIVDSAKQRGIEAHPHLLAMHPAESIIDKAVESGCDLIVMGTHGRSGVDHFLFGSTCERVVRMSTVPVLAVKPREWDFLELGELVLKRVLCPCDLSPVADQAVELAADVCRLFAAELLLVHVVDSRTNYPMLLPEAKLPSTEELRAIAAKRLADLTAKFKDVRTRTDVIVGVPHREIVAYAQIVQADLLVLTTHGYRGVTRALLGSTAERVVRMARVPTLTVKPAK